MNVMVMMAESDAAKMNVDEFIAMVSNTLEEWMRPMITGLELTFTIRLWRGCVLEALGLRAFAGKRPREMRK